VTAQQQIDGLESQIQPLEHQSSESQKFISTRENEVRAARQRIVQWEGENAEASQLIQSQKVTAAGFTDQVNQVEKEKSQMEEEVQKVVEALRIQRQKLDEIQGELTNHEVRLSEKKGDRNHLSERILREYQTDLATLNLLSLETLMNVDFFVEEKTEEPESASAEQPAEGEQSAEAALEEVKEKKEKVRRSKIVFSSWDDVALRVAELRAKLQSMGPVNLEAVQEFEELEQRYQFLTREHDDLVLSKEQLQEIIKKINVTTKSMFAETFYKIQENFKTIFVELFGGGKADLLLTDDTDPLECGIEIVAKPPGKQLQSIMLLSGGERTMTAVALLFAIYMVKPSPFCVLDEMDAPLDESNINRFVKMLERFLEHSQFVIITHNKRTIGMADALYGVTMEDRGVSKLVSVKFNKKEKAAQPGDREIKPPDGKGKLLVDVPALDS
jgi:chromosome segregation protein